VLVSVGLRRLLSGVLPILCLAVGAEAQKKKDAPEFTRQGLLIVNFAAGAGADAKLGRKAADVVRGRVDHLVNHREVDVIDDDEIRYRMERAGFQPDSVFEAGVIRSVGKYLRADEYVLGRVSSSPSGVKLSGLLVLMRDPKLRQALPEVSAPKLDSAANMLARSIAAARGQLAHERRCENALHDGSGSGAIAAARDGIAAYPPATIARTCLLWALSQTNAPAIERVTVAREILTVDPSNPHALEAAAIALDTLRRRDEAADAWLELAATDTSDMDLALRVSYALLAGGNIKRAEPFIVAMSNTHPDDIRLLEQKWHVAYDNRNYDHAIEAAESMLVRDSVAVADSTFFLRLATAYHTVNKPYRAIETLARAVATFPNDQRVYALYAQYIKAEADTVIPRGLALFPRSADLLALDAKDLRAKGRLEEALAASKSAVSLDSTMAQGMLMVAQTELELGRPDSALASLHKALGGGEDSSLVAQFALAKGNALYRAATTSKTSADFALALRYVSFADTIKSSEQSKFLMGVSALGITQSALTEAAKIKDKGDACKLVHLGADMAAVARNGLQAGQNAFGDAAKQSLDYLDQVAPYIDQGLTTCANVPGPP
jgi:tetratricopeptide (TPR) repeat protein